MNVFNFSKAEQSIKTCYQQQLYHARNSWSGWIPVPERNAEGPPIARFMGPTWGPSGAARTQVGPMLAPWTWLSGTLDYWELVAAISVANISFCFIFLSPMIEFSWWPDSFRWSKDIDCSSVKVCWQLGPWNGLERNDCTEWQRVLNLTMMALHEWIAGLNSHVYSWWYWVTEFMELHTLITNLHISE